jgi:hypothetical protein
MPCVMCIFLLEEQRLHVFSVEAALLGILGHIFVFTSKARNLPYLSLLTLYFVAVPQGVLRLDYNR